MKLNITLKLYSLMIFIFVIINLFGFIFNSFYIEKMYISNSEKQLLSAVNIAIDKLDKLQKVSFFDREQIESETGIKLNVIEKEDIEQMFRDHEDFSRERRFMTPPAGESFEPPQPREMPLPPFLRGLDKKIINESVNGKAVMEKINMPDNKLKLLIAAKADKNGNIVIASKSIMVVKEAAQIANKFYNFASLGSLIIGMILIFIVSQSITKPIIELNNITRDISKLNFDKKADIKTGDELEELGTNINQMSEELKKNIEELKSSNSKLVGEIEKEREIEIMRREFISNVSHEFKTPLSIISGYAEGLKELVNIDSIKREKYSGAIIKETEKMSDMVNELLELSKIETAANIVNNENFDLIPLIKELELQYNYLLEEKKVKISVIANKEKVILCGDVKLIERAVGNLLSNAAKYVNKNGKLEIKLTDMKQCINVEVYNSGEKIPNQCLEHIWTPFYKVEESRKRENDGTGLGLAIVKGVIERYKGKYCVENMDIGVKFTIQIPKM